MISLVQLNSTYSIPVDLILFDPILSDPIYIIIRFNVCLFVCVCVCPLTLVPIIGEMSSKCTFLINGVLDLD